MRMRALLFSGAVAVGLWSMPAHAQVGDAERATARDLFKQGDKLQRSGDFAAALDTFQRAEQIFSAPTNMLRIAECEAALGRFAESAESYRAVMRTPLPAGAPAAFKGAVGQARSELAQVEPRVPKLIVSVEPQGLDKEQMQVDGQNVPAALIGEPMPLDPGTHTVIVSAPGYASTEQRVTLAEHDSKSLPVTLQPVAPAPPGMQGTAPASAGTTKS
ncbi:MAG: PEGA domain-containing protein, partial [Polyangiaceae bacterium]